MDWRRADPVKEITQRIDMLRADREAWQHQLEDAVTAEIRALGLLDAARAAEDGARTKIRDDSAEIDVLLDELSKVPQPRRKPR